MYIKMYANKYRKKKKKKNINFTNERCELFMRLPRYAWFTSVEKEQAKQQQKQQE